MIQPTGFFKIHRDLFIKPIWKKSTPEQKSILITLLAMAWFRPNKWEWKGQQFETMPGQLVTSLDSIAKEAGDGISVKNVRTALKRFEKLEFLTNESAKTGRLITIVNWGLYQDAEEEPAKLRHSEEAPSKTGHSESAKKSKKSNFRAKEQAKQEKPESTDTQGIVQGLETEPAKEPADTGQRPGRQPATKEEGKECKKERKVKHSADFLQGIVENYPGRKVKKVRDKKLPKLLEQYGEEQIRRCISRYAEDCRLNTWRGILNESTFWNTRHVEYLDEFYKPPDETAASAANDKPADPKEERARRQADRIKAKLKKSRGEL
jgi:hypothetical protein